MPNQMQMSLSGQEIAGFRNFVADCTGNRLSLVEAGKRFMPADILQAVARFATFLFLPLGYALWVFPPVLTSIDPTGAHFMLSMAVLAAGFATAVIARRGIRRAAAVDGDRMELELYSVNSQGRARVARHYKLDQIVSMFIRRPVGTDVQATLCMRLATSNDEITVFRASLQEAELLHEALCRNIRHALLEATLPGASDRAVVAGKAARTPQVKGARAARMRTRALVDAARRHAAEAAGIRTGAVQPNAQVATGRRDELV